MTESVIPISLTIPLRQETRGMKIAENVPLQCTHFRYPSGCEMYITKEAYEFANKLGLSQVEALFMKQFAVILSDSYGSQSLDTQKNQKQGKTINRAMPELTRAVGLPLVIKGHAYSDSDIAGEEDYLKQFLLMRELQIKVGTVFEPNQKAVVRFCPVFGALKMPIENGCNEWLVMKEIVGGKPVRNIAILSGYYPFPHSGFDVREHPELAQALHTPTGEWDRARDYLWENGLMVTDMKGANVLYTTGRFGVKFYTIIDQRPVKIGS